SVSLTWTSSAVDHFEVWRNSGAGFVMLNTAASASYTDNSVSANMAYVYKVRAVDASSNASSFSNLDLATTVMFTDDPLVPAVTTIKALHAAELAQAVNIVRAAVGLGAFSFSDPPVVGGAIRLSHVIELRNALDPARASFGLPPLTYTTLSIGDIVVAAGF